MENVGIIVMTLWIYIKAQKGKITMNRDELKEVLFGASILASNDFKSEKLSNEDRLIAKACGKLLSYIIKAL